MKRISIIFTAVLLALTMTLAAMAEEIDYSSMSIDELYAMREDINAELSKRGESERDLIYEGQYVVGRDIKEGGYIVTADSLPVDVVVLAEKASIEKFIAGDFEIKPLDWETVSSGEERYITLETGNALIVFGKCRIKSAEDQNWRP